MPCGTSSQRSTLGGGGEDPRKLGSFDPFSKHSRNTTRDGHQPRDEAGTEDNTATESQHQTLLGFQDDNQEKAPGCKFLDVIAGE